MVTKKLVVVVQKDSFLLSSEVIVLIVDNRTELVNRQSESKGKRIYRKVIHPFLQAKNNFLSLHHRSLRF
jgi:hypothetical protein